MDVFALDTPEYFVAGLALEETLLGTHLNKFFFLRMIFDDVGDDGIFLVIALPTPSHWAVVDK